MILASHVYETILDISRKDLRGRSFSPEEYSRVARVVNETLFAKYYSEFENSLENSEVMSVFKVLNESVPIVAGVGALPTKYYHVVGMPYYIDTNGITRYLDLVSALEHSKREQDYLTKASLTYPTFRFGIANTTADMTIHVTPSTGINPIYIDYIRTPDIPYLDYYLNDTTANYTWMSAGATVTVPSGSTARDGTPGVANVVSQTVNWEWTDADLPLIINLFLQQLGIQLPSSELYEGGTLGEQKINNL